MNELLLLACAIVEDAVQAALDEVVPHVGIGTCFINESGCIGVCGQSVVFLISTIFDGTERTSNDPRADDYVIVKPGQRLQITWDYGSEDSYCCSGIKLCTLKVLGPDDEIDAGNVEIYEFDQLESSFSFFEDLDISYI